MSTINVLFLLFHLATNTLLISCQKIQIGSLGVLVSSIGHNNGNDGRSVFADAVEIVLEDAEVDMTTCTVTTDGRCVTSEREINIYDNTFENSKDDTETSHKDGIRDDEKALTDGNKNHVPAIDTEVRLNEGLDRNDNQRIRAVPPLPAMDNEGYVVTGYGEKQMVDVHTIQKDATMTRLHAAHEYMHAIVYGTAMPPYLENDCLNRDEMCTFWAAIGMCEESNKEYMQIHCAPACMTCDQLIFENRCPPPTQADEETNVWKTGDLNRMFERIISESYYREKYGTINVMLRPGMVPPSTISYPEHADSPWIVVLDKFLTTKQCDTLIELGTANGYNESLELGTTKKWHGQTAGVVSGRRKSMTSWCNKEECYEHPITRKIRARFTNLTGIPDPNAEYIQLLKYEVGHYYKTHHDYIPEHNNRKQGVRILTILVYLNDVEQGGATNFPSLNVTIVPKRGRAVVWASVLNDSPTEKDVRVDHQALPVEKGIKYAANVWFRIRDFKEPFSRHCE